MHRDPQEDSLDIRRLQRALSGRGEAQKSQYSTAREQWPPNGPPFVPATPTKLSSSSANTFTPRSSDSGKDRTGTLNLDYHPDTQDQYDETQADSASFQEAIKAQIANMNHQLRTLSQADIEYEDMEALVPDTRPPTRDTDRGDLADTQELDNNPTEYYPEAKRFGSPEHRRSSVSQPPAAHNPLAHLNLGGTNTADISLTQAFNAVSSPAAPRLGILDSPAPPTPSGPAEKIMAKSLNPILEVTSLPAPPPQPILAPPSPSRTSDPMSQPTSPRARSLSPAAFSSPAPPAIQARDRADSDDELFSQSEILRRKAAKNRHKGDLELRNWMNESTVRDRKQATKLRQRDPQDTPVKEKRKRRLSTPPARGVASSKEEDSRNARRKATGVPQPEDTPSMPQNSTVQIPASDPPQPSEKAQSSTSTFKPLSEDVWAELHGLRAADDGRPAKRIKSASALRQKGPLGAKPSHVNSLPASTADNTNSSSFSRNGSALRPASLRSMAPFNIPPLHARQDSDPVMLVRESSNIAPPLHETPILQRVSSGPQPPSNAQDRPVAPHTPFSAQNAPLARMRDGAVSIPATSPWERDGMLSPVHSSEAAEIALPAQKRTCPTDSESGPDQLRGFGSLEDSAPILSSREEPDEVDMLKIVAEVGAGPPMDLEDATARESKRCKITPKKQQKPEPLPAPDPKPNLRIAKAKEKKDKGKKTAKPASAKTLVSRLSTSELKKPNTPQGGGAGTLDESPLVSDPTDPLATDDPMYHISTRPPAPVIQNRVFALFKDAKLQYHPATVLSKESQTRMRVMFDDGTEDVLEQHCVRSLDLRVGDVVKVDKPDMKKSAWAVSSLPQATPSPGVEQNTFTDNRGRSTVLVVPKKKGGDPADPMEVPVTSLYLIKSMWSQFADRTAHPSVSIPLTASAVRRTASPANSISSASFPAARRTGTPMVLVSNTSSTSHPPNSFIKTNIFSNMVFALSFGEKESEKRAVTARILSNGGQVLDAGFDELFHDPSIPDESTTESSAHEGSTQCTFDLRPAARNVGFAAVIADKHSRRPKFLQALALGIPCLAGKWIEDSVKKGVLVDWEMYLLPAGESAYLSGATRSRVLPNLGPTVGLHELWERRNKWMAGKSVVFASRAAEDKKKAFTFFLSALGVEKVVRVKTMDAAIKKVQIRDQAWNYVVVQAGEKEKARKMLTKKGSGSGGVGVKVLDEEDLVQSLVMDKELDM